uniref:Solute carrier family 2, facilitated glucose transporter member 10 n=1 Tax=Cyprinus carpio TaxID=7962 RepID=A0A8C1MAV6_CYPCA
VNSVKNGLVSDLFDVTLSWCSLSLRPLLVGLVFGYELGIISGALPQLQAQFYLGCVQQEAVVNALLIGSLSASVIGGWLIDCHGSRTSILFSNLLILGGTVILIKRISFLALVVCRAIIGFAMSISSMSCCIFVSEMVAPERRGLMVTLYEVGITVGILLAYALNYVFSGVQGGWRYMFGLAIIPSLMQLVSIGQQSDRSAGEMLNPHPTEQVKYSVFDLFKPKDNMCRRTGIGLGLVLSQQFTGQPNVLFYASTILFSVGFQSNASAVLASMGLGIVKVIATLLAMVCSDKVGRRSLLIGGCTVLAIGLILTGVLCGQTVTDTTKQCTSRGHQPSLAGPCYTTASANCMKLHIWFTVTWLVLSEIFPKEVSGRTFIHQLLQCGGQPHSYLFFLEYNRYAQQPRPHTKSVVTIYYISITFFILLRCDRSI